MKNFPSDFEAPVRERNSRILAALLRAAGTLTFVVAVYFSGRLGIEMARKRNPTAEVAPGELASVAPVSVGSTRDPVYLARSPETLRSFFASNPTSESRSTADLSGLGIRRLQDSIEVKIIRSEAETVEVMVSSGAIAGAVYWIHYSQLSDPSSYDPIISPLPSGSVE